MYAFEDTIFERLLDALRVGDRVVVTSHLFYEFKTDSERVALAYQLLEEEDLLPPLKKVDGKSQQIATDLRNEGNKAFQKRKDFTALQLYNRSLSAAPFNSKEFALAIANRSAVYWSLGFYEACLADIYLALKNGYPQELCSKLLERKAKCFMHLGKRFEAEKAIEDLQSELSRVSVEKQAPLKATIKVLVDDLESNEIESNMREAQFSPSKFGCSKIPALSYGVNQEIRCASNCIALKYSEEKGRHFVATRDIMPGDVLVVEPPYASILLPEAISTHCYNCLKYCLSPLPCLHCSEAMFCDEKCRSECWDRFHSVDCPLLAAISKNVGKMGLLAVRILFLASKKGSEVRKLHKDVEEMMGQKDARTIGFNREGQYVSTDYWPIHCLIGHSERRANADLFRRSVTAACLLYCIENLTAFFDVDIDDELFYFCGGLLLHYLQSLPCNAHEVSEMIVKKGSFESQEIGAAGYATLSLLNHSCDPNVVRHSYLDWAVLRAICPIKEGAEIMDNYGYHHALHSLDVRRSQLSKQYFFHCMCEACQNCWPLYKDQPTENPSFKCLDCGLALRTNQTSSKSPLCLCRKMNAIQELELNLKASSKLFRETLSVVLAGCHGKKELNSLLQHLTLLGNCIQRPWREFSECQETLKQCLSLEANHIVFSMQSDDH